MGVHQHPALCSTLALQMFTSGLLPSVGAAPQVQTATTRVFDTRWIWRQCGDDAALQETRLFCQVCWELPVLGHCQDIVFASLCLALGCSPALRKASTWVLLCTLLQLLISSLVAAAIWCSTWLWQHIVCNCLGQCYWTGAQDGNLPLLMPVGTSGYPPFHWWGGGPGEAALSLSDRWCGVALPAACSSRSPVASNQLLYLTSLCCTHLLLIYLCQKRKPLRRWPSQLDVGPLCPPGFNGTGASLADLTACPAGTTLGPLVPLCISATSTDDFRWAQPAPESAADLLAYLGENARFKFMFFSEFFFAVIVINSEYRSEKNK